MAVDELEDGDGRDSWVDQPVRGDSSLFIDGSFASLIQPGGTRRTNLDYQQRCDRQISVVEVCRSGHKQVRLHYMRPQHHIERRVEDLEIGAAKSGPECQMQPSAHVLMVQIGRRCHDKRAVDELVSQTVIGQRIEISAREHIVDRHNRHGAPFLSMGPACAKSLDWANGYPQPSTAIDVMNSGGLPCP